MGGGDRRRRRADGGVRLRAARNAILDDEGVAAEVLFPDADVLGTGRIASSPFGTGLAGDNSDPGRPSPAVGPTTAGSPTSSPRSPIAASAWP